MAIRRTSLAILIALALVSEMCTALNAAEPATSMKTGFAERDITPEIGSEKPGGYGKSYHKTLHDPCKVRATVFDDGRERVALVGVDALIVPRSMVMGARKRIQERCGVPGDHVLIGASHSHSSGPVGMVIPGEYDHASPLVQDLAYKKSSGADAEYLKRVEQAVADAVVEADKIAGRTVRCGERNRRHGCLQPALSHEEWTNSYSSGTGQSRYCRGRRPHRSRSGVVGAWDNEGNLLGCIVNFACHATTSPGGISANYIYYLERAIRGYFGDQVVVVFLPGTCGDITQVDNLSETGRMPGEQSAQFVGGRVVPRRSRVLLGMQRGTLAPIGLQQKS